VIVRLKKLGDLGVSYVDRTVCIYHAECRGVIIIITMARQPYMGLGLLFLRLLGLVHFVAVSDQYITPNVGVLVTRRQYALAVLHPLSDTH
jgi:hypothetical protein